VTIRLIAEVDEELEDNDLAWPEEAADELDDDERDWTEEADVASRCGNRASARFSKTFDMISRNFSRRRLTPTVQHQQKRSGELVREYTAHTETSLRVSSLRN